MNSFNRNKNKISLELITLDERIAPTNMSSLGAAVQAARGPHGSLNHDYFRFPVRNDVTPVDSNSGSGSGSGSSLMNHSTSGHGGSGKGSLNHDYFRPPGSGFTTASTTNSGSHANTQGHKYAHQPSSQLKAAPIPAATVNANTNTNTPIMGNGQIDATSAKQGPALTQIFQEYQNHVAGGGSGDFTSSLSSMIRIDGNSVGVDLQAKGDFNLFVSNLESLGMKVEVASTQFNMVEGLLPIDQIPNATNLPQTDSIAPIYKPGLM